MTSHRQRTLATSTPRFFSRPDEADASGLVAVGGQLTPEWLVDAYCHGIFPWPVSANLLAWWSPDPRAVMEFDRFHVSRRLARTRRTGRYSITIDRDFIGVLRGCATAGDRASATWLNPAMQAAYARLHRLCVAHSVEAWDHNGQLAGGVYGVSLGAYFAAESMFFYQRDASKVALMGLVEHLQRREFQLLDIQQLTPHTARLGGTLIPRKDFLRRLSHAIDAPVTFI